MSAHQAHLPGTPARNGLPEWRGYRYQGTGRDQMPHIGDAELALYKVDYSHWLPGFDRGPGGRQPCGTSAAIRRHYRHDEPLDEACRAKELELRQDRADRSYVTHIDRGDGTPRCRVWNVRDPRMAAPGQDVTCNRCVTGGFR